MYKKMYYRLFNAVTDALEDMAHLNYGQAYERLMKAQTECEEIYLDGDEDDQDDDQDDDGETLRFAAETDALSVR